MNDEDPKAVVPLGMSYKGLSSFYYVCVYEQKINVVALIVSMVQVPSTSAQLLQKMALHKNHSHHYSTENLKRNNQKFKLTCLFSYMIQKRFSLSK